MVAGLLGIFPACSDDYDKIEMPPAPNENSQEGNDTPAETSKSNYDEKYRPQLHFTPVANWMNDPNGMVFVDGKWHLFYQYNPMGNDWGNMSWGHATSTDLIHWDEQTVALRRDNLGDIFSGSAVIDKNNTAGFGANAMVCIYTSAGERQQQSIAYSTDGGQTFQKYSGNPVIANTDKDDFRDPKVFWHEESGKWIMALARGWQYSIDFYSSSDLKNWQPISSFSVPEYGRCNKGQWECPDLTKVGDKWALIVSTNPGGPVMGSGTMYFVGDFDGKEFKAEENNYPLWLDYGMDNYAGVTWSNAGDRKVFIGWMNNWQYSGAVPCKPWRSAMTLPREITINEIDGKHYLGASVVKEIENLAGDWTELSGTFPEAKAYQLQATIRLDQNHTIVLSNNEGQHYDIEINGAARIVTARRNGQSGETKFNEWFSVPGTTGKILGNLDQITLNIYIDQSSVEIVSEDGTLSITNLVFPSSIYNQVKIDGKTEGAKVRSLKSIWN